MNELMVVLGLVSYHCKILVDLHKSNVTKNPIEYIKNRPFKVILSGVGAVSGYFITQASLPPAMNEGLVLTAYFAVGFFPYQIMDKLSQANRRAPEPEVTSEGIEEDITVRYHKLPKENENDQTRFWREK